MDALVPAFVAALLAGIGDRPARLAALLGDRGGVLAGFALGQALAIALSVAGAMVVAPMLSPNARGVLLALALVFAGVGAFWPRKVARPAGPAPLAAATGGFVGGDGTAFLAFALAVRGSTPVLAGLGAFAGAMLLIVVAATMGAGWTRLPLRGASIVAGGLLLLVGIVVGLGALRLI